MRVHHIINSYSLEAGGAERLVRSMHVAMRKRKIDSRLFALETSGGEHLEAATSLELKSPYHLKAIFGLLSYAREHIRAGDLVHAHLFPANLYVSVLKQARLIKAPVVATEHSTFNSRRNTRFGRAIDTILYRGFDRVFAISNGVKLALVSWQPNISKKTETVYNGVPSRFNELLLRDETANPVVLSIGGLRKPKNYDTMLRAFALLNDHNWQYWIAGEGEERAALEELANYLEIESRVRFLGHVTDITSLLEKATVFLMASRWEGFGLAAVEAMNASLPIVVSDVDGLRELTESVPQCAILVDPISPDNIAIALGELLYSQKKRSQLGEQGFVRAKAFSEERMIEGYLAHYHALTGC